jgi:hypothetical protein
MSGAFARPLAETMLAKSAMKAKTVMTDFIFS